SPGVGGQRRDGHARARRNARRPADRRVVARERHARDGDSPGDPAVSISILLADDHEVVRRGVRALLEAEPGITIVGETADGREVVPALERLKPDVLVIDLVMPGVGGLDILKAMTARAIATRAGGLSVHS